MSGVVDCDEFSRWMKQARHTLELVQTDIEAGGFDWACFKSQQAGEYALKALLWAVGRPAFGHNIIALFRDASQICPADPGLEERIAYLDKLYIMPRDPEAFPEGAPVDHFTRGEAARARKCAEAVIRWIGACLATCP